MEWGAEEQGGKKLTHIYLNVNQPKRFVIKLTPLLGSDIVKSRHGDSVVSTPNQGKVDFCKPISFK